MPIVFLVMFVWRMESTLGTWLMEKDKRMKLWLAFPMICWANISRLSFAVEISIEFHRRWLVGVCISLDPSSLRASPLKTGRQEPAPPPCLLVMLTLETRGSILVLSMRAPHLWQCCRDQRAASWSPMAPRRRMTTPTSMLIELFDLSSMIWDAVSTSVHWRL